ncbi:MAG: phosphoenolpyruvate carboxykinase (ATP) [Gammaproteobacteria bacterium]|nr:phosphoenolpyruvate carboxykinase (ATP) [Gammaproteobacteria bacterium]
MDNHGPHNPQNGVARQGLTLAARVWWSLPAAALYEHALRRGEAVVVESGALAAHTGRHTGRSARDKFIAREAGSEHEIWWDNNAPLAEDQFDALHKKICGYFKGREVFVQDCFVGAEQATRLAVRVATEYAWHSLFARNLFLRATLQERKTHEPGFCVIAAPGFHAQPERDGVRSATFVAISFRRRMVLIGGTSYAGEIKKSLFTVMNYLLPAAGVMPMHSSANMDAAGRSALFFGLSGTGKTTLSADAARTLIGDDEHGWSDDGIFNFEGGCYAKTIRLSAAAEPEIFAAANRFGAVLENVPWHAHSRRADFDDDRLTENTRAAYPIDYIPNASADGRGGHPRNIIFLTCDAFGVLPPLSRLSAEQAMVHFLCGYTAKVAGTEKGVAEPTPNFSPCYGGPFLPLHPGRYAHMLGERIRRHRVCVWLINTGWSGGACGEGARISIAHTRAMVNAALDGKLDHAATARHEIFGLAMPQNCPGVAPAILDPRGQWRDKNAYDSKARELARRFAQTFAQYETTVAPEVRAAAAFAG